MINMLNKIIKPILFNNIFRYLILMITVVLGITLAIVPHTVLIIAFVLMLGLFLFLEDIHSALARFIKLLVTFIIGITLAIAPHTINITAFFVMLGLCLFIEGIHNDVLRWPQLLPFRHPSRSTAKARQIVNIILRVIEVIFIIVFKMICISGGMFMIVVSILIWRNFLN